MIIALFGIACVGKTTIGKIISEKLGYKFYDLDAEIKSFYKDTITNIFSDCICGHAIDTKKAIVLQSILNKCGNSAIIAMSPIYYTSTYKQMFKTKNIFSLVLQDAPENIADRMVYTDDDDNVIEDYKTDRKQDLRDIKYFISHYKRAFSTIQHHYNIGGKPASEAADEIIKTFIQQEQLM